MEDGSEYSQIMVLNANVIKQDPIQKSVKGELVCFLTNRHILQDMTPGVLQIIESLS